MTEINNQNTSRGWIFDLVTSIGEDLANTSHLHEVLYSLNKDVNEADDSMDKDELLKLQLRRDDTEELLKMTLANRRAKMNYLKSQAEDYDKLMWCSLKHSILAWGTSVEVWEATFSDDAHKLMMNSTNIMAGVLSMFLGMELEVCQRCLADSLKGETE